MAELTGFKDTKVTLPDGYRVSVISIKPITNSDTIKIEPPVDNTENAAVTAFLQDTSSGGVVAAPNFYVGTVDNVRFVNRAGQDIIVVSLTDRRFTNSVDRSS